MFHIICLISIAQLSPSSLADDCQTSLEDCRDSFYQKGYGVDPNGQILCFDSVIVRYPQCASAWYAKVQVLCYQGRFEEAIACVDMAIELEPENCYYLFNKCDILIEQGEIEEALACIDTAIEENPVDYRMWFKKYNILVDQENLEEAIVCIDRALELNPNYDLWYKKGETLNSMNMYDAALDAFTQASFLSPQSISAIYQRGQALYHLGRYEESVQAYDECINILNSGLYPSQQDEASIWRSKGDAHRALGQEDEAEEAYDQANRLEQEHWEPHTEQYED